MSTAPGGSATPRGERRPLVVQLRVEDPGYPRNSRIREYLDGAGFTVRVSRRRSSGPKPLRMMADVVSIWRDTAGADAAILSEFALPFVPAARLVTRLRGIPLVVDGFVGKYETAIEDWGLASPRSLRAAWCRLVDALSVRFADLFLIDTEVRAEEVRSRRGARAPVLGLPVGAPAWIRSRPPRVGDGTLRVLYFGGNIPLHGLPTALEALSRTDPRVTLDLVFYGPREQVDAVIARLGIADRCTFHDQVDHRELIRMVHAADAVLGIFGDSPKARGVVANKVWQGLAAGRPVVTRRAAATEQLSPIAGRMLTLVDGEQELAAALDALRAAPLPDDPTITERLESFVAERFDDFGAWLRARSA
jgi:glycosyltransferase involved in cell wall biosynthesis